jgi:hypothetical protein
MRSEEPSSLEELEAGLRRAEAERDAPPASGEVKQVLPLAAYLDERAESARWRVVSELRDINRTLYNSFGNERFLAETISDLVAQIEGKVTWAILVRELERSSTKAPSGSSRSPWRTRAPRTIRGSLIGSA